MNNIRFDVDSLGLVWLPQEQPDDRDGVAVPDDLAARALAAIAEFKAVQAEIDKISKEAK